jgi:hypothetical protein
MFNKKKVRFRKLIVRLNEFLIRIVFNRNTFWPESRSRFELLLHNYIHDVGVRLQIIEINLLINHLIESEFEEKVVFNSEENYFLSIEFNNKLNQKLLSKVKY